MKATGHHYRVDLSRANDHLIDVCLSVVPDPGSAEIRLTLPAWCPGSYLIRDYARFVRDVEVHGDDGDRRSVHKVDKSTWSVAVAGARELTVRYAVYAHDLSVRTNHADATHALVHGPATFLYCDGLRRSHVTVELVGPEAWTVSTGLAETAAARAGRWTFAAETIDDLFDSPIHVGEVSVSHFAVEGIPFELAIWGRLAPGAFSVDDLCRDLGAIARGHIARVGAAPFARYTFVLMLTADGYGGLEHHNSSINLFHPQALTTRKHYEALLELLSHELFHAWNGKRIAPAPLVQFDLSRETPTPCLWLMEGMTSHYDRWGLRDARVISVKSYLDKVLDDWSRLTAIPGRHRHSIAESSFDAWIKLYKPDESNLNTTVSYYLKGGLVMFALDLHIRRMSDGKRSLDDVLRALWRRYGEPRVAHPDDLAPVFSAAVELDLDGIFAAQILGRSDPDLAGELLAMGLELRSSHDPATVADGNQPVWMGCITSGVRITSVFDGGPAMRDGLSPGDDLVAIERIKVTHDAEMRAQLTGRRPGDRVEVAVFRRGRLTMASVLLEAAPPSRWEIAVANVSDDGAAAARFAAWMGEPLPSAGTVLASVTTTTRSF